MNIYFSSLRLVAPFVNDVNEVLPSLLEGYWKENGFSLDYPPVNQLKDSVSVNSRKFSKRKVSPRLGSCTLSDFHEITLPGDDHASYLFSVITTDTKVLHQIMADVKKILVTYVVGKLKEDQNRYHLEDVKNVFFKFEDEEDESVSEEELAEAFDFFPHVCKIHEWFLANGNYPVAC